MFKQFIFIGIALIATTLTGCKQQPKAAAIQKPKNGVPYYMQVEGPYRTESQFIVETVVSDLAEQLYYAKFHRLPQHFKVTAAENTNAPVDTAEFQLHIQMDSMQLDSKLNFDMQHAIWSPDGYRDLTENLAKTLGLSPASSAVTEDTRLLSALTDGTGDTIEAQNETLSDALENDFTNPVLHDEAALLLGAFALREYAGTFCDIRVPLSRMTAQLAVAHFLRGTNNNPGINGQIANAILTTLMNNEAAAIAQLDAINTSEPPVAAFVRALRMRTTGDYRLLDNIESPTRIERQARFCSMSGGTDTTEAWEKLADWDQKTVDFVRIAASGRLSVQLGNMVLGAGLPLEMREVQNIYKQSQHTLLTTNTLIKALNEEPARTLKSGKAVRVTVIDWGLWASFFQHEICQDLTRDFYQLQRMLGIPDDAKTFASEMDSQFGGLTLYPFIRRYMADDTSFGPREIETYDLMKILPHRVPTGCWTGYSGPAMKTYIAFSSPYSKTWFSYEPLPGTVFSFSTMASDYYLTNRPDAADYLEKLHSMAPWDISLNKLLLQKKYSDNPTYDQVAEIYSNVLPYNVTAMLKLANTVSNNPAEYEKIILPAAEFRPDLYYRLAQMASDAKDEDKAMMYYDKGADKDSDRVGASYYAERRVRYYLKKGNTEKARAIAEEAADVYSEAGLHAEGTFQELTGNYDDALQWYEKIEERYEDSSAVVEFCNRYKEKTGSTRFDDEIKKRLGQLFPNGIEKATLGDFSVPPADGVVFNNENGLLRAAGLKMGDVIVAVNGIRVHDQKQYMYGRSVGGKLEMDLIVWQGNGYHEIKASPPNHMFGVDIGDYRH